MFSFLISSSTTVEPWYNEVPRDWAIYFVIAGVCNKQNPDKTVNKKLLKIYVNNVIIPGFDNR